MAVSFGAIDYAVFILTLLFSVAVGLKYGCFGSKQKSGKEYLYGKKKLKAIPVGLSIYSSMVSALAIIGTSADIYVFGTEYTLCIIGSLMSMLVVWIFILPVFNGSLNIKTPYEYYELRFGKRARQLSTCMLVLHSSLLLPLVLFSCCLTFAEATGIHMNICTSVLGAVCIFYTFLGGFQTVVWTDVFQSTLMMAACVCISVLGVERAGGLDEVWTKAERGGRINFFNWNPSPFQRLGIFAVTIGQCFSYTAHMGCSAGSLQRYMSLSTEKEARKSIAIGIIGFSLVIISSCITGISMYAFYEGCDPVLSKTIPGYPQLTTYFALDTIQHVSGLSGLFTAGILSAGLSSVSADTNILSGIIYYDFIQKKFPKLGSDQKGAIVMKCIVLVFGTYLIIMAPVMSKIKYLIPTALTLSGGINGSKLSLIILGTTFPRVNEKGAVWGVCVAFIFICWIAIGGISNNVAALYALPLNADNCTDIISNVTVSDIYTTLNATVPVITKEPFLMYKLSFLHFTLFFVVIAITIANIVSYFTGFNDIERISPRLLIPFVRPKKNASTTQSRIKMLDDPLDNLKNVENTARF